jgi:hypothetical protein
MAAAILVLSQTSPSWGVLEKKENRPVTPNRFSDLPTISDSELRQISIAFCAELRTFETRVKASRRPLPALPIPKDATHEQVVEVTRQQHAMDVERGETERLVFVRSYLQDMRALRTELVARLQRSGMVPPQADGATFEGFLAGATPISAAADYLEKLARMLPAS